MTSYKSKSWVTTIAMLVFCLEAAIATDNPHGQSPAPAPAKKLRIGFGDNSYMPTQLLNASDLVCTPADLGRGTNSPQIKMTKFTNTAKMTRHELAKR